jgi:hypothetical protein
MQSHGTQNQRDSRLQRSLNREHNSYAFLNSNPEKRASFGNSKESSYVPASRIKSTEENKNPVVYQMKEDQRQNSITRCIQSSNNSRPTT